MLSSAVTPINWSTSWLWQMGASGRRKEKVSPSRSATTQLELKRRERIMRPDYSSRLFLGSSYCFPAYSYFAKERRKKATTAVFMFIWMTTSLGRKEAKSLWSRGDFLSNFKGPITFIAGCEVSSLHRLRRSFRQEKSFLMASFLKRQLKRLKTRRRSENLHFRVSFSPLPCLKGDLLLGLIIEARKAINSFMV